MFSEVKPHQNFVTNVDMFQFTMKGCMESCNRCGSKVYIFIIKISCSKLDIKTFQEFTHTHNIFHFVTFGNMDSCNFEDFK